MRKKIGNIFTSQVLLILSIGAFVCYFSILSILRHENFHSRRLDLGNMDQTVWNVLHGNGFTLTDPTGTVQESRLAVHADFLLILLAPFYRIWSSPNMLLIIQVIVAGFGAIPVYWIAMEKLHSKKLAVLFAVIYLLYPPMQRKMLHDFHAVSLTTTFLLYAYWFVERRNYVLFGFFSLLAGLGKETVWLTIAMLGMYTFFVKKSRLIGLFTVLISIGIFYYLFWIAIPAVTPDKQHFALVYLSEYGDNLNGILKNLLRNPFIIIRTIFLPDRLYYLFQLLSPVGFLSLFSPFYLLFASESFAINLLSNNQLMRQIDYQYGSTITPFIFISAIHGFSIFRRLYKEKIKYITVYLSMICILTVYLWGEFPIGKSQWFWFFITPIPEKQALDRIVKSIDSKMTVSVTNNIGSHFSQRQFLYNFPINSDTSDYSVIYLGDPYAWPSGEEQRIQVRKLLNNTNYELLVQEGNLFAFKRIKP